MSLLSYDELCTLIDEGVINAPKEHVNSSSIDITLGEDIFVEKLSMYGHGAVDLSVKECNHMQKVKIPPGGYVLQPGAFILAHSQEIFNLPLDISCEYKLKSTMARAGLNHATAGWCDAGWNGSVLTLEFKNTLEQHRLILRAGMKAGQMVFFRHKAVPADRSYAARGSYNGDTSVMTGKGIK